MKIIEYFVQNLKNAEKFWAVFGFEVLKKNKHEVLLGHLGFPDTLINAKLYEEKVHSEGGGAFVHTEILLTIENPYAWYALSQQEHMNACWISEAGRGCALVIVDELKNKIVFQDAQAAKSQLASA